MSTFIGREKELSLLNKAYHSLSSQFIPIYGRRRVGKSELILHFIKNKQALYFLGKKGPPSEQIREFLREAATLLKQPLLVDIQATNWSDALNKVISQKKNGEKLVLVFDEFQWMAEASPDLPFILQGLLDGEWKKRKDIFLIVCGSYMGFMEREVLGKKSPLFGRRTAQILLTPFPYWEAASFHPHWSLADRAKAYFMCGGVPFYLQFFDDSISLFSNIQNNFFNEYSALFREPEFLLREELRELQNYYGILCSIATGSETLRAMAQNTGIDEKKLHYYLQNLLHLNYIQRHQALTTRTTPSKEVRFILCDPLLRFWFRFIYPQMGAIVKMKPRDSFLHLAKPHLESYFGSCFEFFCREALARFYQKEEILTSFEIGQYWDKKTQIDVVGIRKNEGVDLGECKWGKVKSVKNVIQELETKIALYPNPKGLSIKPWLFLQTQPLASPSSTRVKIMTLEKMYEL